MLDKKKNIIVLILLIITYIPLLSFTLGTLFLNGHKYWGSYELFMAIELILLNLVLIILIIETLSSLFLFNLPKVSIINERNKDKITLILLLIIYIPLFLVTLLILVFSGIDDSCKFMDLTGFSAISHTPCITRINDLIFEIDLILLNLVFIATIIKNIGKLDKINEEKGE